MQNLTDEIKDLLLTRSLLLQRVSNSLTKDIINAYVSVIDDILSQIATGKSINLANMNKIINELNAKLSPDLTSVKDDLVQLGINEASYIANGINGAIGIDLVSKLPTDRTVQKIVNTSLMDGLTLSSWLEDKDSKLKLLLKDNIQQGVIQGETIPQIVSRLKGVLTINKEGVKALAITAVATVTNQVRMQTYKENEDIFKGYEHNSTLDNRTTLLCGSRDGAYWDLNGKGLNEKGKSNKFMTPPLHFRCRSLLLPITKSFKELGVPLDEIPKGTRSSMDGYVSRDTTFEKWFEGKPKAFQEEYLGKSRYELYKKGTIAFSDLVNQNGRVLKVSELAKISPIAKVSNVPTIDFGYDGKFNKYVENIRDEAKIVIDKLPKPKEMLMDRNYYKKDIVSISKNQSGIMFLHEYGHHIDDRLKDLSLKRLEDASIKDGENLKIRFKRKELYTLTDSELIIEFERLGEVEKIEKEELLKLKEKWFNTKETKKYILNVAKEKHFDLFSDIVDSITMGDFNELYEVTGHGKKYFSIKQRRQQENFANLFSLWSGEDKNWNESKKLFPNLTKEFENIMKEVIDGKFD